MVLVWRSFLILAFVVFYACVSEKEETTGSVYGVATNTKAEPIRGASVSLYDKQPLPPGFGSSYGDAALLYQTVTYDDGHFEFTSIATGKYYVIVKCSGYEDNGAYLNVIAGMSNRIDFVLRLISGGVYFY